MWVSRSVAARWSSAGKEGDLPYHNVKLSVGIGHLLPSVNLCCFAQAILVMVRTWVSGETVDLGHSRTGVEE
jgi:hypothetical protein